MPQRAPQCHNARPKCHNAHCNATTRNAPTYTRPGSPDSLPRRKTASANPRGFEISLLCACRGFFSTPQSTNPAKHQPRKAPTPQSTNPAEHQPRKAPTPQSTNPAKHQPRKAPTNQPYRRPGSPHSKKLELMPHRRQSDSRLRRSKSTAARRLPSHFETRSPLLLSRPFFAPSSAQLNGAKEQRWRQGTISTHRNSAGCKVKPDPGFREP